MKKLISTFALIIGTMAFSQITIGARANALFNTSSASWDNLKGAVNTAVSEKGDNAAGFNLGLAFKVDFPVSGWFVMPEIYYTSIKNTVNVENTKLEAKNNRVDVPVMIGHNFLLGKVAAFVGPVASFNLAKDNTYADFKENGVKSFSLGYQFGAQLTISKIVVNARYEGAFSKDSRKFINTVTGTDIRYDNRPSMFILGLGYNFK